MEIMICAVKFEVVIRTNNSYLDISIMKIFINVVH
jgi:hypothetical protein